MFRSRLKIVPPTAVVVLVTATVALATGWSGNTYTGTVNADNATGNDSANIFFMLAGDDFAYGQGGEDQIRGGKGLDVLHGQGGYDTIWACGMSDKCDGSPGEDWMYSERDGAQINAGQYPAKKQHIICGNDFEVVYFDSADVFEGTKSLCDAKHNVSNNASADVG